MPDAKFVLDANIMIEASQRSYPFDLDDRFWKCLVELAKAGKVCSIDRVKQELLDQGNSLADWARTRFHGAFANTNDPQVIAAYSKLQNWANAQTQFTPAAKAEFANVADAWLVAYALAKKYTVVTHEAFAADITWKVKIPNACKAFGVDHVNTIEMLRALNVKLG